MSNDESNREVLSSGDASGDDRRRIIALQQQEIRDRNERQKEVDSVEDLTRLLKESEEQRQNLQTKLDNYEKALKRDDAKIAYLEKKLGIGPHSTFGIDVVSPGISPAVTVNENTTATTNATSKKEQEKIVEEKDKVIAEQLAKIQELSTKNEDLSKRISKLSAEVVITNEAKQKAQHELVETKQKCSDFEKKCAGFFNQVVSLNSKQQESEEEISSLKRACENLHAQLAEKEDMMVMMRDLFNTYEDDFRREREEKASIQKRMESTQQENERLKHEIQLNNASENRTPLLVTGDGNEASTSTTNHQGNAAAMISPVLVECPLCSGSFSILLIDNHIQCCMDYKDYNTGAL